MASPSAHNSCQTAVGRSTIVVSRATRSSTSAARSPVFIAADRTSRAPQAAPPKISSTLMSDVNGAHCRTVSWAPQP
ncbi:Uncharacterised protein [Mycobacterium tuberculosis]|uniref:Uncharacterized protein n=1 Tax=Mycobacterium tuberculosis TaxID=1773 RepID=A0A0U0RTV0_MYCTX|nr:Uncharacterised protein [Mycobacterium tuberculosis]